MATCFSSPAAKLGLGPRAANWERGTPRVPFRPIGAAAGPPPASPPFLGRRTRFHFPRRSWSRAGSRPLCPAGSGERPGCSCGGIGTRQPTGPLPWAACMCPSPSVQRLRRWRPRSVGLTLPTARAARTRLRMPPPRERAPSSTPHRRGTFAATREASTCMGSHAVIMGVRGAVPRPRHAEHQDLAAPRS